MEDLLLSARVGMDALGPLKDVIEWKKGECDGSMEGNGWVCMGVSLMVVMG